MHLKVGYPHAGVMNYYPKDGSNYFHLLVGSAGESFDTFFMNQLARPDVQLKVIWAGICNLFKEVGITQLFAKEFGTLCKRHSGMLKHSPPNASTRDARLNVHLRDGVLCDATPFLVKHQSDG